MKVSEHAADLSCPQARVKALRRAQLCDLRWTVGENVRIEISIWKVIKTALDWEWLDGPVYVGVPRSVVKIYDDSAIPKRWSWWHGERLFCELFGLDKLRDDLKVLPLNLIDGCRKSLEMPCVGRGPEDNHVRKHIQLQLNPSPSLQVCISDQDRPSSQWAIGSKHCTTSHIFFLSLFHPARKPRSDLISPRSPSGQLE